MKRRYHSPALISAAMDDAGLSVHEFRVLAHVCRRAGDMANGRGCDASVASMGEVCGMKADTVRGCLQRLTASGWLTCEARSGKATEYRPRFPDPSPQTGGVGAYPSPETGGDPSPQTGAEGNPEREPMKGTHLREPESGQTYADAVLDSSRFERSSTPAVPIQRREPPAISEQEAKKLAMTIHKLEACDPDNMLAMFPPEDAAQWGVDWFVTMEASGWQLDGRPVDNPKAALRRYLRKAAATRSKRFRELG